MVQVNRPNQPKPWNRPAGQQTALPLSTLSSRRIACVWLPRFALSVASRNDPLHQPALPLTPPPSVDAAAPLPALTMAALYRVGTRWQELLECSPDLEALGITPDRPLKEAQAQVPGAR